MQDLNDKDLINKNWKLFEEHWIEYQLALLIRQGDKKAEKIFYTYQYQGNHFIRKAWIYLIKVELERRKNG